MSSLVGTSVWTRQIRKAIERVAALRSSALILGPSGTGKELIASAIHQQSPRSEAPFVVVDCTAIPPTLFASQLFGHVKGAFSGAECDTLGSFRAAEGGTLFLDEIGELSLELQSQLLRVLQERSVIPVGTHQPVPVDVRIIAASNRPLAAEVVAGRFRLDLYYRLNVVRLQTRPLRERPEDILPLSRHFLSRFAIENGLPQKSLSPSAEQTLLRYDWPGNVRQLQNILERCVVFAEGEVIEQRHILELCDPELSPSVPRSENIANSVTANWARQSCSLGTEPTSWPTLAEIERRHIVATLEHTDYNQSAAARLLGIDRRLLARRIRKYGIALCSRQREASCR